MLSPFFAWFFSSAKIRSCLRMRLAFSISLVFAISTSSVTWRFFRSERCIDGGLGKTKKNNGKGEGEDGEKAAPISAAARFEPHSRRRWIRFAREPVRWTGPGCQAISAKERKDFRYVLSIKAVSWDLDTAPTLVASTLPFLKIIRVGMPRMPNFGGVAWFSSMLSLATFRRPAYSWATSSRIGAIILQGPHHSAQ